MKRILCSTLALLLALSLCACGESGGDTGPTYPAAFAGLEDQIDAAREEGRGYRIWRGRSGRNSTGV